MVSVKKNTHSYNGKAVIGLYKMTSSFGTEAERTVFLCPDASVDEGRHEKGENKHKSTKLRH